MTLLNKDVRFSDIPINLTTHPIRKDIIPLKNEEAVKRAIKNVIFTGRFERRFQPNWGAGIPQYLFENIDDPNISILLRNKIAERIRYRELRANVLEVAVRVRPDNNSVELRILFSIANDPRPIVLDTLLERVR